MHATIIARSLRIRPDQAHRAGSFGLPADGRDAHLAEDLVQTALGRLYVGKLVVMLQSRDVTSPPTRARCSR